MKTSSKNRIKGIFFIVFYAIFLPICNQKVNSHILVVPVADIHSSCIPTFFCKSPPALGPAGSWHHAHRSPVASHLGSARHRGLDLLTSISAPEQKIQGELRYGLLDKDLEGEEVEIYACQENNWHLLGETSTDSTGNFTLSLALQKRLPIGKYPIYVSVKGDRSSFSMLAIVLPAHGKVVVSDIDGTLTTSENAYPKSMFTEAMVLAHEGAKEVLTAFAKKCYQPVYVTARGDRFTTATRTWLTDQGFPEGPVRLVPSLFVLPGEGTSLYKKTTLTQLQETGVEIAVGIGNRASDIKAYGAAHVPLIFIKRPEFDAETKPLLDQKQAVGFSHYRELLPEVEKLPQAPSWPLHP